MSEALPNIHRLHDATLLEVVIAWELHVARLRFRVHSEGDLTLVGEGLRRAVVPIEEPWGPSVSVNGVRGPSASDPGLMRLEIEMQSGDTLTLDAQRFRIEGQNAESRA